MPGDGAPRWPGARFPRLVGSVAALVSLTAAIPSTAVGPATAVGSPPSRVAPGAVTATAPVPLLDGESADRWRCLGYNGLRSYNPSSQVAAGIMRVPSLPAYRVARGTDVDWRLDPFRNPSWRMWLHSLNWLGDLVERADVDGDVAARGLAMRFARDYVVDNPVGRPQSPEPALEATARRTNVLTCLYRVSPEPWLRDALLQHASWLSRHWSGAWNKGLDEDLAVLGVACVTGTDPLVAPAVERLGRNAAQAFDSEGLSNEQAPAYTQYAVTRWRTGLAEMRRCGLPTPDGLEASLARAEEFLAHATRPNGRLAPIGDSEDRPLGAAPGTGYEYAASGGTTGVPPTVTTAVYRGGWAFGRSAWAPFADATWYALRFGSRPLIHGHDDLGQVLFAAQGRDVLVEGGYDGYRPGPYRDHLVSRFAHNVFTVDGAAFEDRRGTDLVAATTSEAADAYALYDVRNRGAAHHRSVLIAKQSPFVAVLDTARAATSGPLTYTQWWHLPRTARAAVVGRTVVARDRGQTILVVPMSLPGSPSAGQRIRTSVARGRTRPTLAGWVSPGLYQRRPAPTAAVTVRGRSTALLTVVLPLPEGTTGGVGRPRRIGADWQVQVNVGGRALALWVSGSGRLSLRQPA